MTIVIRYRLLNQDDTLKFPKTDDATIRGTGIAEEAEAEAVAAEGRGLERRKCACRRARA